MNEIENEQKCKICLGLIKKIFSKKILKKYNVDYFQCESCGFIQTEKPFWLKESYSEAITSLDIGLVWRNLHYSEITADLIFRFFNKEGKFLDFAGGYGLFTRIMRDKGFDFYHQDKYCQNLFALKFSLEDLDVKERKFELITSFEMMEHVENPFNELDLIFSMSDNFLFSTELVPSDNIENWWYLGEEHGQHISFFTKKSLEKLAEKYGKRLYSDASLHLLTNKEISSFKKKDGLLKKLVYDFYRKLEPVCQLSSKLQSDFEMIRKKQNEQ